MPLSRLHTQFSKVFSPLGTTHQCPLTTSPHKKFMTTGPLDPVFVPGRLSRQPKRFQSCPPFLSSSLFFEVAPDTRKRGRERSQGFSSQREPSTDPSLCGRLFFFLLSSRAYFPLGSQLRGFQTILLGFFFSPFGPAWPLLSFDKPLLGHGASYLSSGFLLGRTVRRFFLFRGSPQRFPETQ